MLLKHDDDDDGDAFKAPVKFRAIIKYAGHFLHLLEHNIPFHSSAIINCGSNNISLAIRYN
jgi:hypothetical protein